MNFDSTTYDSLKQAILSAVQSVAESIPALITAMLIVVAGWLVARLGRRAAQRLSAAANRLLERVLRRGTAASVRLSPAFVTVASELTYWLVLIFALTLAASVAGLGSVGQWLNRVVLHLPSLIVGVSIIIVGYFCSVYLRELVTSSAQSNQIAASGPIGRIAQGAVLTVTIIIGLDQAGIDVAMLMIVFAIVGGGLMTALTVAFGFGARDYVSNLIGARNARHFVQSGLRLRVSDVEGEVLELSHTHVALDTAEGKIILPARTLETEGVMILAPAADEHQADG